MGDEVSVKETNETAASKRHQEARDLLSSYLNKRMRITLSDGRTIIGNFLCTDRDSNIVLSSCEEFLRHDDLVATGSESATVFHQQPRTVGLSIVPGEHVRTLSIANNYPPQDFHIEPTTNSAPPSPDNADVAATDLHADSDHELTV